MKSERDPVLMEKARAVVEVYRLDDRDITEVLHDFALEQRRELGEEIARAIEADAEKVIDDACYGGMTSAADIARALSQARTNKAGDAPSPNIGPHGASESVGASPASPAAELLREVVEAFQCDDVNAQWFDVNADEPATWQRIARALTAAREFIEEDKADVGSREGPAAGRSADVLEGSGSQSGFIMERGSGCPPSSDHANREPSRESSAAGVESRPTSAPSPTSAATLEECQQAAVAAIRAHHPNAADLATLLSEDEAIVVAAVRALCLRAPTQEGAPKPVPAPSPADVATLSPERLAQAEAEVARGEVVAWDDLHREMAPSSDAVAGWIPSVHEIQDELGCALPEDHIERVRRLIHTAHTAHVEAGKGEATGREWRARPCEPGERKTRWEVVCRDASYCVTFDQKNVADAVAELLTRMESPTPPASASSAVGEFVEAAKDLRAASRRLSVLAGCAIEEVHECGAFTDASEMESANGSLASAEAAFDDALAAISATRGEAGEAEWFDASEERYFRVGKDGDGFHVQRKDREGPGWTAILVGDTAFNVLARRVVALTRAPSREGEKPKGESL